MSKWLFFVLTSLILNNSMASEVEIRPIKLSLNFLNGKAINSHENMDKILELKNTRLTPLDFPTPSEMAISCLKMISRLTNDINVQIALARIPGDLEINIQEQYIASLGPGFGSESQVTLIRTHPGARKIDSVICDLEKIEEALEVDFRASAREELFKSKFGK